jgi:hypothetical protein
MTVPHSRNVQTAFYQVRGEHVVIVAVMHERQRPEYWRDRLR